MPGLRRGAALTRAGNAVGTLGAFTSTGDFSLTDSAALTVGGTVAAGNGRTLTLATDTLNFGSGGVLSAPGGTVALQEFTSGHGVALASIGSNPPVVANTLTVGSTAGGPVTIAGTFNLANVPVLNLLSAVAITESAGGALQVGTLAGSGASASLNGANLIGTLGGFTTTGAFSLNDGQSLAVGGPLSAGTASLTTAGALTLTGALNANTLTLVSTTGVTPGGGINQTGGTITAGTLTGSALRPVSLTAAGNAVTTLGSFSSVGGFALTDASALSVTGPVTDNTSVRLNTAALSLAGTVTAPSVTLNATGAIAQPGGSLQVSGTLAGTAAGAALTQAGNSVGTLGAFTSTGDFSLTDSAALTVGGVAAAGNGRTLTLATDTLNFGSAGVLSAPGGTVALQEFTSGHGVALASIGSNPPVVANTLTVGSTAGGPVTIAGTFNLANVPVLNLLSAGAITESAGGALQVATLAGSGASAALNGANLIGTLGGFTTTGAFSLADGQSLTVAGPLNAASASLTTAGALTLTGAVNVPNLTLVAANQGSPPSAAGAINQTGGSITATTLTGSAASTVSLTAAGNAITYAWQF